MVSIGYLKLSHQCGDDFIVPNLDCISVPQAAGADERSDFPLLEGVLIGRQLFAEWDVPHCTVVGFGQQQVIAEAVQIFALERFVVGTVTMWASGGLGAGRDMLQLWTLGVVAAPWRVTALALSFQVDFILPEQMPGDGMPDIPF